MIISIKATVSSQLITFQRIHTSHNDNLRIAYIPPVNPTVTDVTVEDRF